MSRSGSKTSDGHYVFGRLDQHTVGLTTRVNYTLSPRLSIQIYAQPFVSAGDYCDFKELVDGRTQDVRRPLPPVRLHLQPGLQLPLVPNHERPALGVPSRLDALRRLAAGARGDSRSGRRSTSGGDIGGVFDAPATNVFLVKWAYWLNY